MNSDQIVLFRLPALVLVDNESQAKLPSTDPKVSGTGGIMEAWLHQYLQARFPEHTDDVRMILFAVLRGPLQRGLPENGLSVNTLANMIPSFQTRFGTPLDRSLHLLGILLCRMDEGSDYVGTIKTRKDDPSVVHKSCKANRSKIFVTSAGVVKVLASECTGRPEFAAELYEMLKHVADMRSEYDAKYDEYKNKHRAAIDSRHDSQTVLKRLIVEIAGITSQQAQPEIMSGDKKLHAEQWGVKKGKHKCCRQAMVQAGHMTEASPKKPNGGFLRVHGSELKKTSHKKRDVMHHSALEHCLQEGHFDGRTAEGKLQLIRAAGEHATAVEVASTTHFLAGLEQVTGTAITEAGKLRLYTQPKNLDLLSNLPKPGRLTGALLTAN
jgi:hypothetical protein